MENLNGIQAREYNRAQTLNLYFSQQTKVYKLYAPFAQEVDLFTENNNQLIALVPTKDVNGISVTISKGTLKTMVATLGNTICTRTAAYANKINDIDLKTAIYHRTTEIKRLKDADVLGFVTRLVGIVKPLIDNPVFQPYLVTQDMLDSITNTSKDFNDSIGAASIIDGSSSFASRTINDILKKIRENIVQFNLLLNFFDDKQAAFVEGYISASAINNTGIRHSGIEGIILNPNTGLPVSGATITGEGKNKITYTGIDGTYKLIKLKVGTMKITFTAPGYTTQIMEVKILRGKISELNINLSSQMVNMATA